ncbi:MAG TPA: class I SAM-dependent methyltransferase [Roseiflexaceae bacterium]|nr:class I SAM-dependent methyltransferase [Roseiflexaceae bacterium]
MHSSSNLRKHTSGNPLQRALIARFHRAVAQLAAQTGARRALDAGCGEGFGLQAALVPSFPAALGLDLSVESLQFARRLNPASPFVAGSLTALPFPDGAFDLVACLEVLEHLERPEQGLEELCRVSARWLLLSVPNEPLFRGANFLRGKNMRQLGNDPGHLNHWSARSFERFVARRCHVVARRQPFPWTLVLCQTAS